MQKIRKILRAISKKIALRNNQPIINNNTDLIGPGWRRSKKEFMLIFCLPEEFYLILTLTFSKEGKHTFNSLSRWAACSGTGGCRGRSPLSCTHMGRTCKKTTLFWRKLNAFSENVSFDSELTLAFEIQPFKDALFVLFFLMQIVSKHSRAEWVNWIHGKC